ncbi:TRAP transporter large permease subunit [Escherichia coli]
MRGGVNVLAGHVDVQIVAQTLVNGADNLLLAISYFVLAGEIMNAASCSKRIFYCR